MDYRLKIIILSLSILPVAGLEAQEYWTPVTGNPIQEHYGHGQKIVLKSLRADTLDLPFLDDFSTSRVIPDPELWTDRQAYANNDFCIDPPSIGVVTLDCLDENGSIYTHAVSEPWTFEADALSSRTIRLDYPASDSIYLSFFYQSAGLGDDPEESDSLLLDFWSPSDSAWINVWAVPGEPLTPFEQVMIPVRDNRFLTPGFRFRFRNLASIAKKLPGNEDLVGNVDQWNIDYVKLDRNRNYADTILRDVAFTTSIRTVLVDYSAIPWSHLAEAYNTLLDQTLTPRYKNHDSISRNVSRKLMLEQPWWGEEFDPGPATAQDLPAGQDTVVELDWFYPGVDLNRGDSGLVRFTASLRTDEYDLKVNDTLVHDQLFTNFFSYDDGSAESSYGLRGKGTDNGSVAQRFESFIPDRIGGVDISFNQMADSVNADYYFDLMVWANKDDQHGAVLFQSKRDIKVEYPATHPGFVRYYFGEPVDVNGIFYVGWKQYRDRKMNVGLDLNSPLTSPVIFANWQGYWQASGAPGPLLIRPFLWDGATSVPAAGEGLQHLKIWPNPATDLLYLDLPGTPGQDPVLSIYDASGRICLQEQLSAGSVNISRLPQGIYFLRLRSGPEIFCSKLLIQR